MTGTPAISFQSLESDSLDLPPAPNAIERHAEAILCVAKIDAETRARFSAIKPKQSCACYTGMGMATLARKHLSEPKPGSRATLLTMPVTTRADAMAALSIIESDAEDSDLRASI